MLQLSNFYRTASTLPLYSIENGYTYLHPSQKKKPSKSAGTSARTSRAASPTGSQSSLSRSKETGTQDDDALIANSFQLTLGYGDEYMDENPLIGEPGSFRSSMTGRGVKDKETKERERERLAVEAARSEKARSEVGETSSQKPSGTTSPVAAAAPLKPSSLERKATGLAKGKSPTSALGEGVKKRRKSKAPVTPGVISPS
jgi:mediator of RNA polymerase II transcription subunit 6